MIQFIFLFLLISFMPASLLGQQDENVYLSFDESYVSPFDSAGKSIEYKLYGITRDLVHEYVNSARLADTAGGAVTQSGINEFLALFSADAEVTMDFNNSSGTLSPPNYAEMAQSRYANTSMPLIIEDIAIADIDKQSGDRGYLVQLNLRKSLQTKEEKEIPLKMEVSVVGNMQMGTRGEILSIKEGIWEREEKRVHLQTLGVLGGKSIFPEGEIKTGFTINNEWTVGLAYNYIIETPLLNNKLSIIAGIRAKYSRLQTSASAGSILSNNSQPNELQISFLTGGQEQLDILGAEALLGFDYALFGSGGNQFGIVAAFSPKLTSVSSGGFTGAIEYSEIWDGRVTVSNVINCGLDHYEGSNAVDATYQGLGSVFTRNVGVLFSPYYQLERKAGLRWRLALEAQYFPATVFQAGQSIFVEPVQPTLSGDEPRVQYSENSLLQAASADLSEFYFGLQLSYCWPMRPVDASDKRDKGQSPFSNEKLEDFDGKGYLILNGDITDAEAAARIQKELGPATQFVWIINTTQLENVIIPGITELLELRMENNSMLQNISIPRLKEVYDVTRIENNQRLQEFHVPSLSKVYNFEFRNNNNCTSIQLPRLNSTGNEFLVSSNDRLKELLLPGLKFTIGDFVVAENEVLPAVKLPGISSFGGGLSINLNQGLQSIELPDLKRAEGGLNITGNTALRDIQLPLVDTILDGVNIFGHQKLTVLHLPRLKFVERYLEISSNPLLREIRMPLLQKVGGALTLSLNSVLKTVEWPGLKEVNDHLSIHSHDSLVEMEFPVLERIGRSLRISQNHKLKKMHFPVLTHIKETFTLTENSGIDSFTLPQLESADLIYLESNSSLTDFFIPNLKTLKGHTAEGLRYSGHGLWIAENPNLAQIEFPGLHILRGKFFLHRNHQLGLIKMDSLSLISGDLTIRNHRNLREIQLPSLDTVAGSFSILLNDELRKLPLPDLNFIGGELRIQNNPNLRDLEIPELERIKDDIYASFNALRSSDINRLLYIPYQSNSRETKTIHLQGQLPKASPSGSGWSYKAALQRGGNEVETD